MAGAGIVGGAYELDAVQNSAERERRRSAVDQVFQRLHEDLKRKILAIDMAINLAFRIDDGGLRQVIEAAGHRAVTETQIAQQRFDSRGIRACDPPVRGLYALNRRKMAQPCRGVVACIEPNCEHGESIWSEDAPGLGDCVDNMLGGERANRAASRINQTDNQRLAAVIPQRQWRSLHIDQRVVSKRSSQRLSSFGDRSGGIELQRCGPSQGRRNEQEGECRTCRSATPGHDQCRTAPASSAPAISSASCTSDAKKFAMAFSLEGAL